MNIIDTKINTISKRDNAEPSPQSPVTVNCCSIIFPIKVIFPPLKSLDMTNVDKAGMNVIVIPDITPGTLKGNITFPNTL